MAMAPEGSVCENSAEVPLVPFDSTSGANGEGPEGLGRPIPVLPRVAIKAPTGHQRWNAPPMPVVVPASNGQMLGLFFGQAFHFSNFHPAPFWLAGHEWRCVEHYYVHEKLLHFGRQDLAIRMRFDLDITPAQMKTIGGKVEEQANPLLRLDWTRRKAQVMLDAVRAKFTQNAHLREALVATGNLEMVEASASDKFWGSGLKLDNRRHHADIYKWRLAGGMNMLGLILNAVRDELTTAVNIGGSRITWRPGTFAPVAAPALPAPMVKPSDRGSAKEGEILEHSIHLNTIKTGEEEGDGDALGGVKRKKESMGDKFRRICGTPLDCPMDDTASPSKKRSRKNEEGDSWLGECWRTDGDK